MPLPGRDERDTRSIRDGRQDAGSGSAPHRKGRRDADLLPGLPVLGAGGEPVDRRPPADGAGGADRRRLRRLDPGAHHRSGRRPVARLRAALGNDGRGALPRIPGGGRAGRSHHRPRRGRADAGRCLARPARSVPRRRAARRPRRRRLVVDAATGALASPGGPGLVVLRRGRRSPLHSGAARRRRSRGLLRRRDGRAGVAPRRSGAVLGSDGGRRPARDAHALRRQGLRPRRHRSAQRPRRRRRLPPLAAPDRRRYRRPRAPMGLLRLAAVGRRPGRGPRRRPGGQGRGRLRRRHRRAALARAGGPPELQLGARDHSRRAAPAATASSCCSRTRTCCSCSRTAGTWRW